MSTKADKKAAREVRALQVRDEVERVLRERRGTEAQSLLSHLLTTRDIEDALAKRTWSDGAPSVDEVRAALRSLQESGDVVQKHDFGRAHYRWRNDHDRAARARRDVVDKLADALAGLDNTSTQDEQSNSPWWFAHEHGDVLGVDLKTLRVLLSEETDGEDLRAKVREALAKVEGEAPFVASPVTGRAPLASGDRS